MFPPSHSWMAPLVEDMLHNVKTGFTEAVVTGPGRAVFFCGRPSQGDDLTMGKARDAIFLLTGVAMQVGKPVYLATNPMTIQEGQWVIAQAITDCHVKARGPGCPYVNLSTQQPFRPFRFDHTRVSHLKDTPGEVGSNHRPLPHWPPEVKTTIVVRGTKDHHHLSCCCLPQTVGSRVTGVHYPLLRQYSPGQIDQRDLSIPDVGDNIKKMEPI